MPLGLRVLRNVDLVVLAIAIPVWVVVELPAVGWVATSVSWVAARWFQSFMERRAYAKGKRQAVLAARAASLIGRLYVVTIAVFIAGLIDRKAGLSGAVLAVAVFTAYFISLFIRQVFEEDAG